MFFNRDARTLVLDPIERMMEKVNFIAKNPMAACSDELMGLHHLTQKLEKDH